MYATPIVYPLSQIPDNYKFLYYINPVSAPIELFRVALYGVGYVPVSMAVSSVAISIVSVIIGLTVFTKNERSFIDVA